MCIIIWIIRWIGGECSFFRSSRFSLALVSGVERGSLGGGRWFGVERRLMGLRDSYTGFTPLQQDRMHTFYANYRAGK